MAYNRPALATVGADVFMDLRVGRTAKLQFATMEDMVQFGKLLMRLEEGRLQLRLLAHDDYNHMRSLIMSQLAFQAKGYDRRDIFLNYLPRFGTLMNVIDCNQKMSPAAIRPLFREILCVIEFCHSLSICFGTMCPATWALTEDK